jgi:hypothetical protein
LKNTPDNPKTLGEFPIGARLLVRTKKDWRTAVVSQFYEEKATLIICSPNGRTYRLRRLLEMEIIFDGKIPILKTDLEEDWRENFTKYDFRW